MVVRLVSHRTTCKHADDSCNLRDRAISRTLAVERKHGDGDDANDARNERAVSTQRCRPRHGCDSAALGCDGGAASGATSAARSQPTVTRAPATSTVAEIPTSGRPCAVGSSTTREPTGVTHDHGRSALDAGADAGDGTGGRCAPEQAPRNSAARESREVITPDLHRRSPCRDTCTTAGLDCCHCATRALRCA